jgi:3,4-dihydroxy-2-butanone 4-phosphate synthase
MTTNSGSPVTPVQISPVEDIVADLRAGRIVIMVDDEDRENEGDLLIASDHITAEAINFMARFGRGLICLTLTRERCEHLKLPPMATSNGTVYSTAFTVSIEAAEGVTTGISAADRALTVKAAVAANATAKDLVQPGHIFPLQAVDGGVLMRAGHTEAGCDLGTMAGCSASSVICEIMKDDGTMARLSDLQIFAAEHGLKIGRKIGFPTANIARDAEGYLPLDGVYAGWLISEGKRYPAAHSVGINETFQAVPRLVESHVLDETELDLYDKVVSLEFVDFVRPAAKFDGVEALVKQINLDLDVVRNQLGL